MIKLTHHEMPVNKTLHTRNYVFCKDVCFCKIFLFSSLFQKNILTVKFLNIRIKFKYIYK